MLAAFDSHLSIWDQFIWTILLKHLQKLPLPERTGHRGNFQQIHLDTGSAEAEIWVSEVSASSTTMMALFANVVREAVAEAGLLTASQHQQEIPHAVQLCHGTSGLLKVKCRMILSSLSSANVKKGQPV